MAQHEFAFGPFVFDAERNVLMRQGNPVVIGQRGAALLGALLSADGRVISKDALLAAAWKTLEIDESNLAVQIAALRKVLGRTAAGDEWITTVHRVGYQFAAASSLAAPPALAEVPADPPAIAVLPFDCHGAAELQLLGDALAEDIILGLARWRLLSVLPRSHSFRFRYSEIDAQQAALQLSARYLVEGSIRRLDGRTRIVVRLSDALVGRQLWAERFDFGTDDTFALHDRVVTSIIGTIAGRVEAGLNERARGKPAAKLAAYECVLQGSALPWNDQNGSKEAIRLFAGAIEIDPDYGLAHAMLAIMLSRQWQDDWTGTDEPLDEAYRLARRAIELDPQESTTFALLGHICSLMRSYDLALQYGRRATEINPNNQWNVADLGYLLMRVGQLEQAIDLLLLARQIDPFFDAPWHWFGLGLAHMLLGRFEEAAVFLERMPGETYWSAAVLAGCHASLRHPDTAQRHSRRCLELRPDFSIRGRIAREQLMDPPHAAALTACLHQTDLPKT